MKSQLTRCMVLNKKSYIMHDPHYEEIVSKKGGRVPHLRTMIENQLKVLGLFHC